MRKGEETQERVVERALQLATRDGLDGLTIGSLAAELGLSKSGLFAHFRSKEDLQLQVLKAAAERFRILVIQPALAAQRGEPRVRALFDNWFAWGNHPAMPGGCIFVAAAIEFDDRPGPLRDFLVESQTAFLAALARAVRLAAEVGHFRPEVDAEQFAFDMYAIVLGFHHASRLLHDNKAELRARTAFERLLALARA